MFEAHQEGVVVRTAGVTVPVNILHEGILRLAECECVDIKECLKDEVTCRASLVSGGHDELVSKVDLSVERVVLGVDGGLVGLEVIEKGSACDRKICRVESSDGIRIWRVSEERVGIACDVVYDSRVNGGRTGAVVCGAKNIGRIVPRVARDGYLGLVIVQALSSPNNSFAVEHVRTKGETELRTEVTFLGVGKVASLTNREA